jgi:hypothetical protein
MDRLIIIDLLRRFSRHRRGMETGSEMESSIREGRVSTPRRSRLPEPLPADESVASLTEALIQQRNEEVR